MTTQEFIQKYKWIAIWQHIRFGIPASITLAQGIVESGSGNSRLAKQANNFFGIKAYSNPDNLPVMYFSDDVANEPFRVYPNANASFTDHSKFLLENPRYDVTLKAKNYVEFAKELKKAGYATAPNYAQILISTIENNDLYQYDWIGNNKYLIGTVILIIILIVIVSVIYYRKK